MLQLNVFTRDYTIYIYIYIQQFHINVLPLCMSRVIIKPQACLQEITLYIYIYLVVSYKCHAIIIPVNPPPLCGSLSCKSLISCVGDVNLPHTPFPPARSTPNKHFPHVKKILTYILRSIFLEIPPFGTPALTKNAERYDLMISSY